MQRPLEEGGGGGGLSTEPVLIFRNIKTQKTGICACIDPFKFSKVLTKWASAPDLDSLFLFFNLTADSTMKCRDA